jgi:hypothetical protein
MRDHRPKAMFAVANHARRLLRLDSRPLNPNAL